MGIIDIFNVFSDKTVEKTDFSDTTIGIPRALHTYEYFPFIQSIVRGILPGCKIKMSPESDNRLKANGEKNCPTEPCFSVKLAFGHIQALLEDETVHRVLIPAVIRGEAPGNAFPYTHVCPYVQALPQMAMAGYMGLKNKIVPLVIQMPSERRAEMVDNIIKTALLLGRTLSHSAAKTILDNALAARKEVKEKLYALGRETIARAKQSGKPLFVLLGRTYNLSDKALNAAIPDILADRGYEAITVDMLYLDDILTDPAFVKSHKHTYWLYHQRLLAGAEYVSRDPENLRAIFISNFGCGPDSFIIPQVQALLGAAKLLVITVDSQDARANVVTRVEAYLNTMDGAKQNVSPRKSFGEMRKYNPISPSEKRIIALPNMCNAAHAIAALFRSYGVDAYVMAETTRESMELGCVHTTGQECYPCMTTTGDMAWAAIHKRVYIDRPEMIMDSWPNAKGQFKMDAQGKWYMPFDPEHVAFFQGLAAGPCRYGQYLPFQHHLLNEILGYDVRNDKEGGLFFVTFDAEENYNPEGQGFIGKAKFKTRAWRMVRFIDFLEKAAQLTRPREINPGETNRVFEESLAAFIKAADANIDVMPTVRRIGKAFQAIPIKKDPMPVVQMVGEVYVRLNGFANQYIARELESQGIITLISSFGTWIKYISAEYYDWTKRYGGKAKALSAYAELQILNHIEKPLAAAFGKLFDGYPEPTVEELYASGSKYIDSSFSGEAIISAAELDHAAHLGYDGGLNVMPFTCMPSNIVRGVMPLLEERYPDFPLAHLEFDGSESPVHNELVEGFVYQVHRNFETKRDRAAAGAAAGAAH